MTGRTLLPDATPQHGAATGSISPAAKAGLAAFILAASALLLLLVITLTNEKISPWKAALPKQNMTQQEADTALATAKYLHEAEIRPLLIKVGFASMADVPTPNRSSSARYPYRSYAPYTSKTLTDTLWSLRAFPKVYNALLHDLLDTQVPPQERAALFSSITHNLDSTVAALVDGAPRWGTTYTLRAQTTALEYFANDPILKSTRPLPTPPRNNTKQPEISPKQAREIFQAKHLLAEAVLPILVHDMKAEKRAQPREEVTNGTRKTRSTPKYWDNSATFSRVSGHMLSAIWAKRDDSTFRPNALEVLRGTRGTAEQRYLIIPLMGKTAGLSYGEYVSWAKHSRDLTSITNCLGTNPRSFAYLISCCDTLGDELRSEMTKRGVITMNGGTGSGITLTELEKAPTPQASEKLYFLADMSHALAKAPKYDLTRAYPIFAGTLLKHLENQPLILPVDPQNPDDAALLAWYFDKGWEGERLTLFSAKGTPADIATHWAYVHLMWWTNTKTNEQQLALMHMESGFFLQAILPILKGEAAVRFMGPVTNLWFAAPGVSDTGWKAQWQNAKMEETLLQIPASTNNSAGKLRGPVFLVTPPVRERTGHEHFKRYKIDLTRYLQSKYPDTTLSVADSFAYAESTVDKLYKLQVEKTGILTQCALLFWRFKNDREATEKLDSIFAMEKEPVPNRLKEARKVLNLPEKDE